MTRTRLIALSALTALTVAACGSQGDSGHAGGAAKVVTTTNVWGSVATAVAGGHADVKSLLTSDVDDPHSYEATPADAAAIADAAAGLVGGPVTIEDVHSRVLAYSSRQEVTDPARVSTIVGRRVPDDVLRHQRARGVFRRLAASPEPFLVTGSPDSPVGTRYVIPVHAGGEWLGSIWAVVGEEPAVSVVAELRRTASVVALHLLQSDGGGGVSDAQPDVSPAARLRSQ